MRLDSRLPMRHWLACAGLVLAAIPCGCSDSAGSHTAATADAASDVPSGGGHDTATIDAAAKDTFAADTDADTDADTGVDTATGDITQPDTSASDASTALQWLAPLAARRGPVAVQVSAPAGISAAAVAQATLQVQTGGTWKPATLLQAPQQEGAQVVFVWDSFADFAQDGPINGRASLAGQVVEHSLELRNAAATARVVLTAHPSTDLPSGGSGPQNNEIGALVLAGGALQGSELRVHVGKGPESLSAAPHGRATANVDGSDGTFSVIATPLDAAATPIQVLFTQALPHGWAADLGWSRDGRSLYVLGTAGELATQPATLWRYDPAEDLSSLGQPTPLATFERPAVAVSVERNHPSDRDEWAYVVLGPGPNADLGQVVAVARKGGLAAPALDSDVAVPNDFAVSPAGGLALLASDLFGNVLVRYDLGKTIVEAARVEPKKVPFNLVFHPASTPDLHVLLVSNLDKNSVTPFTVTPTQVKEGAAVTGLPLAAEMDLVERGPEKGLVVVSALNQLIGVQLATDGTAKKLGTLKDFGSGTPNFTGSVAVQR